MQTIPSHYADDLFSCHDNFLVILYQKLSLADLTEKKDALSISLQFWAIFSAFSHYQNFLLVQLYCAIRNLLGQYTS